jgi:adenylate cyclase
LSSCRNALLLQNINKMKNGAKEFTAASSPETSDPQRELERRVFHLKTLYDVSQEISFLKDPQEIINNLLLMIMGTFGSFTGLAVLIDTDRGAIDAVSRRGVAQEHAAGFYQALVNGLYKELKGIITIDDLTDMARSGGWGEQLLTLLSAMEMSIWIPFRVNETLRGGIGLGSRLSGDGYSVDDQELLTTLASQGAVSIGNAKLIEQMKKEENIRANLARYLSPQVVEQIIKHDVEVHLGGERKEVTVLFSDIRDFTAISEKMPPDQLVRILNEYFTEMAGIIFNNQGSVDKYIGDAIVAVYGSLIEIDNHAELAVKTATDMMTAIGVLNKRWQEVYNGFTMDIGIGINTGRAFLGNIGSPQRMEFTVIGDMVNVAARLSCLAKPGQILVSKRTFEHLDHGVLKYVELPPCTVKGKSESIEVFECVHKGGKNTSF